MKSQFSSEKTPLKGHFYCSAVFLSDYMNSFNVLNILSDFKKFSTIFTLIQLKVSMCNLMAGGNDSNPANGVFVTGAKKKEEVN